MIRRGRSRIPDPVGSGGRVLRSLRHILLWRVVIVVVATSITTTAAAFVIVVPAKERHRYYSLDTNINRTPFAPPRTRRRSFCRPITSSSSLSEYNALVDQKLAAADACQGDAVVAASARSLLPTVDFVDLMKLSLSEATSNEHQRQRRKLARQVQQAGGYCLVCLDEDEPEVVTIDNLWDSVEELFLQNDDGDDDPNDSFLKWRHQTLTRNDHSHANSGYQFVQTSLLDHSFPALAELIGTGRAEQLASAYRLLSILAKAFAVVVYAGSTNVDPAVATDIMNRLLNDKDNDRPLAGAYHRLCRYVQPRSRNDALQRDLQQQPASFLLESLRSHCDWTLSTPIPISATAGLEVFSPVDQHWLRPEEILERFTNTCKKQNKMTREAAAARRWNSRYVLVMTGKWMELLTDGTMESCIHRVVTAVSTNAAAVGRTSPPRLSAPFFLRPQPRVFADVEDFAAVTAAGTNSSIHDVLLQTPPTCRSLRVGPEAAQGRHF